MRLAVLEKARSFKSWAIEPVQIESGRQIVLGVEAGSLIQAYLCALVQKVCPDAAQQIISSISLKQAVKTSTRVIDLHKIKHDSLVLQGCLLAALRDQAIHVAEIEQMVVEIDERATNKDLILGMHFASVRDCLIRVINQFVPDRGLCLLSNGRFDKAFLKFITQEVNFNEIGYINVLSKDPHAKDISDWALDRRLVCQYHYSGGERILGTELHQVVESSSMVIQFGEPRTDKARNFLQLQGEIGTQIGVVDKKGLRWLDFSRRVSKPKLVKQKVWTQDCTNVEVKNGELF